MFGLLWMLIQHYHINQLDFLDEEITGEEQQQEKPIRKQSIHVAGIKKMEAKEKILFIVNDVVEAWGLKANNFTSDFQDGRILNCLAFTRDPSSVVNPNTLAQQAYDRLQVTRETLLCFEKMGGKKKIISYFIFLFIFYFLFLFFIFFLFLFFFSFFFIFFFFSEQFLTLLMQKKSLKSTTKKL